MEDAVMRKEEWEKAYRMYYRPVYAYALFLSGNCHDAEDLVQETFIRAYLSYEKKGNIRYWLLKVTRNGFVSRMRKRKKEIMDDGTILERQCARQKDALQKIIEDEEKKRLFTAVMSLPVMMRTVLAESVFFQLTDDEIAELHGLSRENVRKIRSRARRRLKEKIREE